MEIVGENNQVTDSLRVYGHFYGHGSRGRAWRVWRADGKVLFMSEYQKLIDAVAAFEGGDRSAFATEQALYNHFWSDDTTLTSPRGADALSGRGAGEWLGRDGEGAGCLG